MWNYYCEKCEKQLDFEDIELLEIGWEGDWEECCKCCQNKVKVSLKLI